MKILIDGMHMVYRAYYTQSFMSNSEGIKTGIIFGFLQSFNTLFKQFNVKPYVIWEGRSFRKQKSETYKEGRQKDESVFVQVKQLQEILSCLNIKQYLHPNLEADDVLAFFAKKFENEDQVIIVTSDKDLFQVVNDKIIVYDPIRKLMFTKQEVLNKMGVLPEKVGLHKTLLGDASDNIKGIPRMFKKDAINIINKYNSLDEIYNDIENLGKYKEKFTQYKNNLYNNKELVTLVTNFKDEDLVSLPCTSNLILLEELFTKYEFKSFSERMEEWKKIKEVI